MNPNAKYLVIQQRSPCRIGSISIFVNELMSLLSSLKCKSLFVLTGALAKDKSYLSKKLFLSHKNCNIPAVTLDHFSLQSFDTTNASSSSILQGHCISIGAIDTNKAGEEDEGDISNMKIAKEILKQYDSTFRFSNGIIILGCICEEGDNIIDAKDLLSGLNTFDKFKMICKYIEPDSWKSLYGSSAINCEFY